VEEAGRIQETNAPGPWINAPGRLRMESEAEAWLAVRRDHDGNLDVLRLADGRFAWGLTEDQADAVIAHVQSSHRKVHGQSYWKLAYIKGTLRTFLKANNIRA
jgi:hypothetical protein